jgi:hypothetical protein
LASGSGDGVFLSVGTLTGDSERKTIRDIKKDVKMLCKWVSLSLGPPLRKQEGIRLPGLFERKKKIVYAGSFFGPREY